MSKFLRRHLLLASVIGTTGSLASSAPLSEASISSDEDLLKIKNRLLSLDSRGSTLTVEEKFISLLAVCAAQALENQAREIASDALGAGVKPLVIREAVYQTAPYVGIGRVEQTMRGVNAAFKEHHIELPLPSQTTVSDSNRLEKGIEVQTAIFGDTITQMHKNTSDNMKPLMIDDLSGYCFGDFYTRSGLNIKERELAVFSCIAALGACEPQLKAHGAANLKEGYTKQNLFDALQIALPLNGFPRTLNALAVVNGL